MSTEGDIEDHGNMEGSQIIDAQLEAILKDPQVKAALLKMGIGKQTNTQPPWEEYGWLACHAVDGPPPKSVPPGTVHGSHNCSPPAMHGPPFEDLLFVSQAGLSRRRWSPAKLVPPDRPRQP